MNMVRDLLGILALRPRALRSMASRQAMVPAIILFCAGFLSFKLVEIRVYGELEGNTPQLSSFWYLDSILRLNLIQAFLFVSVVYIPSAICLCNALANEGLGLTMSRKEYHTHFAVLLPLWGTILLLTAPVPLMVPHVILADVGMVSIRFLLFAMLTAFYTVWAIRELNHLSSVAALGAFVLSWLTLPVFYLLIVFLFTLPLFVMLPLIYLAFIRARNHFSTRSGERSFQDRLQYLTLNPHDADAHYQLGLIQLRRGNLDSAQIYFERAKKIDPADPDYHYWLGRVFESKGEWSGALEEYEETYRLNPRQGLGDIFREVGKAYLHTGNAAKAAEFLNFFLEKRGSDPEGRYWLAVAQQKLGKPEEMRVQLSTILEQARCNPGFFRRENRQWILRARRLLKGGIL